MAREIDIKALRDGVDAILNHIVNDLGIDKIAIEERKDFYWEVPGASLYEVNAPPPQLDVGRLADDWDFLKKMIDDKSPYVSLMLIHAAPLLLHLAERVQK